MENKKLKLNKENLDVISLMQHIVYISIGTYRNMKNEDFNNESVIHNFELLCNSYIRLHEPQSIHRWEFCYNNLLTKTIKYTIKPSEKMLLFHLIIDLTKDYNNCAKVGIQNSERVVQSVPINVFNIQFEEES